MLIIFLLTGALLVGLGWPLYRGRVKPNSLYGLRVGETIDDERVWYPANAYCGRDFIVLGAVTSLVAVVMAAIPGVNADVQGVTLSVVVTVGALWVCARGMAEARRLKKEIQEKDSGAE